MSGETPVINSNRIGRHAEEQAPRRIIVDETLDALLAALRRGRSDMVRLLQSRLDREGHRVEPFAGGYRLVPSLDRRGR